MAKPTKVSKAAMKKVTMKSAENKVESKKEVKKGMDKKSTMKEVKKAMDKKSTKKEVKKAMEKKSTKKEVKKAMDKKSTKKEVKKSTDKKSMKKEVKKVAIVSTIIPGKTKSSANALKKSNSKVAKAVKTALKGASAPTKPDAKTVKKAPKGASAPAKPDAKTVKKASKGASAPTNPGAIVVKAAPKGASAPAKPDAIVAKAAPKGASASADPDSKVVKAVLKGGSIPVDEHFTQKNSFHVYTEKGETWGCMLNQSNVGCNNNKFYVIQLLEADNGKEYLVWTRWGRVGVPGQNHAQSCGSLMYAKSFFMNKFSSKTGSSWFQRGSITPRPGKYTLIEMEYETEEQKDKALEEAGMEPSKLDKSVQDFVKLICDIDMMKKAMVEIGYDAKKMPLGKISTAMIKTGYEILNRIGKELKGGKSRSTLAGLSSEFYTVIPHDFGFRKMSEFIIDTNQKFKDKLLMVESLKEIQVAHAVLESKASEVIKKNPVDRHYENLDCQLTPVAPKDEEFKMVAEYIANTHGSTHGGYDLVLKGLFRANKDHASEFEKKFKKFPNRQLLWHGSGLANWCGILSQGLRIAPPEAPVSGYMFGKGIYFADMVSKSANYCRVSRGNNRGVLMLCEVALGKCNELMNSNYHADQLPKGTHSTKGIGRIAPTSSKKLEDGVIVPLGKSDSTAVSNACLMYNEYIVYNVDQVRPRYVCELEFKFKY